MSRTLHPGELLEHETELMAQPISVPGRTLEDVLIPARGFLPARTLQPGEVLRIVDVEGAQVADVLLFAPRNLKNVSSMSNTQVLASSWNITLGHTIYSKFGDRMATIVNDTVGRNGAVGGFCNPASNFLRYGIEGTHSCLSNLVSSMRDYGLAPLDIQEGVFCPFMCVNYGTGGELTIELPKSRPGDYLDLRADMEVIVAMSNCPSEHNPCNGWNPTALRAVIYKAEGNEPLVEPHSREEV